MTLDQARDAIVAYLATVWVDGTVDIFYENTTEVDTDNVGDYFIKCMVEFDTAKQANIGVNPLQRNYGTLRLQVFGKQGLGKVALLKKVEILSRGFRFKCIPPIQMQAAAAGNEVEKGGWFSMDVAVPFYFDN